mgnify:FL=1
MNHLPRMDKFDRAVVALITVITVVLLLYVSMTNLYNRYLSHHYVAFHELHTKDFVDDWRHYASEGYVMHIVLYDKSKQSKHYQSQIVSYMTKKKEDNHHYKPVTVDMTNDKNRAWVKELHIKGVNEHTRYPVSLTLTKTKHDNTHIDVAPIDKGLSHSQVHMILERYK